MSERHHSVRDVSPAARISRTAILGLAFLVRIVALDAQGLWRDEVDQWRFALQPWGEMLQNFTRAGWNGPLYSPLMRVWIALTGDSVFAMRYFSLLWGVVSVALLYVLVKRLIDDRAALWSALLLALSPYIVWYAQEIKMYTWAPMLVLLALYALDRACTASSWRWWVSHLWWVPHLWWGTVLIATTLAFYSHLLAALLIPVEVVWFWLHPRRRRHAWQGGAITLALLTLPYLPMLRWIAPMLLADRETGYPAYSLGQMATTLFSGWTLGVSQSLSGGPFPLYIALFLGMMALVGMAALTFRKRFVALTQLWLWMLVPLLLLWLVSLRGPIFTDRYLIWTAPAFYVLAGTGLATIHSFRRWSIGILLLHVLLLNGVGLYRQATLPIKPQFHLATRHIEAQRASDELLLFQIPYNHHVAGYYAEAPLDPWAEAPFTNWRHEDGSYYVYMPYVDKEMSALTSGYSGVWLVYSEVALWDDRELVKQWLDLHWRLVDQQTYVGVTVYYYTR